ncbi:hypothetical protein DFS34DRAFT_623849 [Phlyctochytrium arcticum]|nr:hypothetical protein DFS34DRAFT_623849 [Phlyctochytrium arcticum]
MLLILDNLFLILDHLFVRLQSSLTVERLLLLVSFAITAYEVYRRRHYERLIRENTNIKEVFDAVWDKCPMMMGVSELKQISACALWPHIPTAECECHFDVRHVHLNRKGCNAYGLEDDKLLQEKFLVRFFKRDQKDIDKLARTYLTTKMEKRPAEFEEYYRIGEDENGNWCSAASASRCSVRRIQMICNYAGSASGSDQFVYLCRDITEERRVLQAIKDSEEWTRLILETTEDGIWEVRRDLKLRPLSARTYEQIGYTREEFDKISSSYQKIAELVHPDDLLTIHVAAENMLAGRLDFFRTELRIKSKLGEYKWLMGRAQIAKHGKDGKPSVIVGSLTNMHERKIAELALVENNRQLDAALQQAAAAAQSKADFLANISHELRTPLNGMIGLGNILWDSTLNTDQRDLLKSIRDCSEGLLLIVNDILDFSKIDANMMAIENFPFDLFGCIENAIYLLNLRASEKGIGLYSRMTPGTPRYVWGDGNRLRQVLMNIIGNAVKFTDKGQVVINIDYDKNDPYVIIHFKIRDSGIGIPSDRIHLLFKPFSQVDTSTSRKYGGTGLGLAISQRLVNMMDPENGVLGVTSDEGQGSVFAFSLRFKVCQNEEEPKVVKVDVSLPKDSERLAEKLPMNILLAEDNAVNQKLCMRMLQRLGYRADVANNGDEAVQACRSKHYDLILMDMQMPKMSGIEATRLIRSDLTIHQPTIYALTANARDTDKESCLQAGMDGHISKPFRAERLVEMLAQCGRAVALASCQKAHSERNLAGMG